MTSQAGAGAGVQVPDFDELYSRDPDPWSLQTSWYERRKLAVLLACLPRERYARAWEPGCGIGVTTRALAERTDHLVASDSSAVAARIAQRRCEDLTHVEVRHGSLTEGADGPVDLVVAAEFLYYLPDLKVALDSLWRTLASEAHLAVVHWRRHPHDAYLSGAALHELVAADAAVRGARALVSHRDDEFGLDIYEAP